MAQNLTTTLGLVYTVIKPKQPNMYPTWLIRDNISIRDHLVLFSAVNKWHAKTFKANQF